MFCLPHTQQGKRKSKSSSWRVPNKWILIQQAKCEGFTSISEPTKMISMSSTIGGTYRSTSVGLMKLIRKLCEILNII